METAAQPRFMFKPRTRGMIFVTLTSSASLRTGVVKTFRWATQMRIVALMIMCCLVGCQPSAETSTAAIVAADLHGAWTLDVANEADLAKLNIGTHVANFKSDGTWSFQSNMIGAYDGLKLQGSGEWRFDGKALHCTAGENSRICDVKMVGERLLFSPDPLLVDLQQKPISSEYER